MALGFRWSPWVSAGFAFADTDKAARADAGKASPKAPIGNKKDANAKSSPAAAANDDKKKKSDADSANEEEKEGSKTTEKYAAPTPGHFQSWPMTKAVMHPFWSFQSRERSDLGLAPFVARSLENGRKASAIIFDVDTLEVGSMQPCRFVMQSSARRFRPSPTLTDARSVRCVDQPG